MLARSGSHANAGWKSGLLELGFVDFKIWTCLEAQPMRLCNR
jgi:hypothetical protein